MNVGEDSGSNVGDRRRFDPLAPLERLGATTVTLVSWVGEAALLAARAAAGFLVGRQRMGKLVRAVYELGVRCVPIVAVVGLFTGMVLGLQGYYTLARFGSEGLLGPAVALSLIRELGPVLTALMIVGQAGSSVAAELGIQRQTEQVDALELMGIRSAGYLIGPRLVAALVCFPILTALFDLIGLLGGHLTGVTLMGVDQGVYWNGLMEAVGTRDIWGGFVKSLAFAVLTLLTLAIFGYHTHRIARERGARGVSESTTRAVVWSSVIVLAADYLITSFFI